MICKNCNKEIPNDSEYCSFCGNVTRSVISSNNVSSLKKGYTYLELKQWKDAEQFFRTAIISDENVAEAYIGKMLARYKIDSIESLAASGKKFSNDNDFKLALKYADGEYADYLKECAWKSNSKTKKRKIIISSVCACVAVLAVLTYFVIIPLCRNFYYKDLLTDSKAQKAAKSYQSSKWFEYDKMAKDLFYENGLKLVQTKDYKNAEACFEITDGYADNEKYLDYCKAQNLLADDDLESYNYFTDLGDFLDSKEILSTNEYFVMVAKLQGEWHSPGKTVAQQEREMRESGRYYEANGFFYKKEYFESYQQFLEAVDDANGETIDGVPITITISNYHSDIIQIDGVKRLDIKDGRITYNDFVVEAIDDTHIIVYGFLTRKYEKQ